MSTNSSGFDFNEPGIGKFVLLNSANLLFFLCILIILEIKIWKKIPMVFSLFQNKYNSDFSNLMVNIYIQNIFISFNKFL